MLRGHPQRRQQRLRRRCLCLSWRDSNLLHRLQRGRSRHLVDQDGEPEPLRPRRSDHLHLHRHQHQLREIRAAAMPSSTSRNDKIPGGAFACGDPSVLTPNTSPDDPTTTIGTLTNPSEGSFVRCTKTYQATQDDIDAHSITNTATASYSDGSTTYLSNTASATVKAKPTLTINRQQPDQDVRSDAHPRWQRVQHNGLGTGDTVTSVTLTSAGAASAAVVAGPPTPSRRAPRSAPALTTTTSSMSPAASR